MDLVAGGITNCSPPNSVSLDEFCWNFQRLLREGYPDGIPVNQIEELYTFWLRKPIEPAMLDPSAPSWIPLFENSDLLKLHFKLSKRKEETYVTNLRKGANNSPKELTAVLLLANYSCLMRMKAAMANGRSERARSPDSTRAVVSQSTSRIPAANQNQNTSGSQDMEGSQSVQEIVSASAPENSMPPPTVPHSDDDSDLSISTGTESSQSVSQVDVFVDTENVSAGIDDLPLLNSSASSPILPTAAPFESDLKEDGASINNGDQYPFPLNSSAGTALLEQEDNRKAELEDDPDEHMDSVMDTTGSEGGSQALLHDDDRNIFQDSLIAHKESPGKSSSTLSSWIKLVRLKRFRPPCTVASVSHAKRLKDATHEEKERERGHTPDSSRNPVVDEVGNSFIQFDIHMELLLKMFQRTNLDGSKGVVPVTNDWMVFPVQSSPYEDEVPNRGLYMCREGNTFRFGDKGWELPPYVCCHNAKLQLPPKTLVYGEFVDYRFNSLRTGTAFHVIDVAILDDRFIYDESFQKRRNAAESFFESFGNSRDLSIVTIKLEPAVQLHHSKTEIIEKLTTKQERDGRIIYVLNETLPLESKREDLNLPYVQITGLLLLPVEIHFEVATFPNAIQNRLFWHWRSQLS